MASIRKINNKWQVQIRRKGHRSISKTFFYRTDAEVWGRAVDRDLDSGTVIVDRTILKTLKLSDLLVRYRDGVSLKKLSNNSEIYRINNLLKDDICKLLLSEVTPKTFANYRDRRLKEVTPSTVSREFTIYKHMFQVAINEWDIPLGLNPLHKVKLPKFNDKRSRRLEPGEFDIITSYCKTHQLAELQNVIILAIETGMRRGELLRVCKEYFNADTRTLYIPITKSGHSRTIPLTSQAAVIVKALNDDQKVYSKSIEGFMSAWQRLIKRTGIVDLRFHDLRHEAISRFFEMGLSVPEVALISGHRDYRMLQRYTHLKPEELVVKLL